MSSWVRFTARIIGLVPEIPRGIYRERYRIYPHFPWMIRFPLPTLYWVPSMSKADFDKAIAEGERSIALDPSGARAYDLLCPNSALRSPVGGSHSNVSRRLFDLTPLLGPLIIITSGIHWSMRGDLRRLFRNIRKHFSLSLIIFSPIGLAATYIMTGREKEARAEAAEILRINPKFTIDDYVQDTLQKINEIDMSRPALQKAGLK